MTESILITGIAGIFGKILAQKLHKEEHIIGVDRRNFHAIPKDLQFHQIDIRRKKCEDIFRNNTIKTVIHLNIMHDPHIHDEEHHSFNIMGTSKILEYSHRYKIKKIILLSSADVYGCNSGNDQFLTEEAPLLGAQRFSGMRDLIEIDMLVSSFFWKHPEIETVILRPCNILGKVKNAPSNYLRLKYIPMMMGFDPMMQPIHELDVASAIICAMKPGIKGIFNLAGPGQLPISKAILELNKEPFYLPYPLAKKFLATLWKYKLTRYSPPELFFMKYICMIDGSLAQQILKFKPRFSLKETIHAVLDDDIY